MNVRSVFAGGRRIVAALCLAACLGVAACSEKPRESGPPAADTNPPPASTAQTAIEGFTGKTAVDAGSKARKQIESISARRKQDLQETQETMEK